MMIVKEKFELIYGSKGDIYNVVNLSKSTLNAFTVSKEDRNHFIHITKSYLRNSNSPGSDLVLKNIDKCEIVRLDNYPLPGFVTKSGTPYLNISVIPVSMLSDYSSRDIAALYIYTLALASYYKKKPFDKNVEEHISAFIFSILFRLYGKKAGLIGSYQDLIPKLRFLVRIYVLTSMLGYKFDDKLVKSTAASLYVDSDDVDLKFDFTKTKDFITSINKNGIIPLSENKFSTSIVNMGGVASLPMFEDVSRLFATMLASSVPGNSIFSTIWKKFLHKELYQKLIFIAETNFKRSV